MSEGAAEIHGARVISRQYLGTAPPKLLFLKSWLDILEDDFDFKFSPYLSGLGQQCTDALSRDSVGRVSEAIAFS